MTRQAINLKMKQVRKYIILHYIFNISKIILFLYVGYIIVNNKILYCKSITHWEHTNVIYLIIVFLIILIMDAVATTIEMYRLNKLVNKYYLAKTQNIRIKCCYKIMGYISIYRNFLSKNLLGGCE